MEANIKVIKANRQYYREKIYNNLIGNNLNKNNTKLKIKKQKKIQNDLKKKIIINNKSNLLLISILIFIMIFPSLTKIIKKRTLTGTNEITMTISGTGNISILSNEAIIPNQIFVNEETESRPLENIIYDLSNPINTVKLIYNEPLTSCHTMFFAQNNIKEIDFSKFDLSQVTDMSDMFHECRELTSIDFSGINTQSLTNMNYMFYECNSLQNLDLRSFDTSLVDTMFQTFFACNSLLSIDLSSFDTSRVTTMFQMFFQCRNLKSLDLSILILHQ